MNTASQKSILESNSNVPDTDQGLITPHIPDAIYDEDHEGLLPLNLLDKPLRVAFSGWLAISPGHTCQLLHDGALIGEVKTITTEQAGDPLFLDIPVEYLVEGVFAIAYRATNTFNHVYEDSPTVRLEIVTTPRGLPKLAPMKFPAAVDCGLTSAELTNLGNQLVGEIGSYAGIYQHDVIRTFWGNTEGPGAVVTKTATGVNRIHVTYTRAFLQSLGDFDGFVTYTVEDRAGNISEPSLGAYVRLSLSDTPECSAQHFSNVVDITLHVKTF